jgi:hypothetical protein
LQLFMVPTMPPADIYCWLMTIFPKSWWNAAYFVLAPTSSYMMYCIFSTSSQHA